MEKTAYLQLAKEKAKCVNKNIVFDEDSFREKFVYNSKHIIRQENFAQMFNERDIERAEKAKEKEILEIEKVNKRLAKIKVRV